MTQARLKVARSAGFTLVEVMVVVLIIGIMLTFATLSVGNRAVSDTLDIEARRLEQLFRLAQEEAELKGVELGFRYTDTQYQFLGVGGQGRWAPLAEGPLRAREIPAPLWLALRVDGRAVPPSQDVATGNDEDDEAPQIEPQVMILSSGEFTAFTLEVGAAGLGDVHRISGTLIGKIERERTTDDTWQ